MSVLENELSWIINISNTLNVYKKKHNIYDLFPFFVFVTAVFAVIVIFQDTKNYLL